MLKELLRYLPSIDALVQTQTARRFAGRLDREWLVECARDAVAELRERMLHDELALANEAEAMQLSERLLERQVERLLRPSLHRVINATGIILHTGLGRAVLPPAAIEQAWQIISGYSNLEIDLETAKRGDRTVHVERLLCKLTGAEAACVVNNNAAAVLIALNTLANRKQVLISRGELIEIGGSFRIPDVMAKSGAKMVEVGTTNKTHLKDFASAITEKTAGILHVHTSNYRILGFTAAAPLEELVTLARKHNLFVLHDLGGGILIDLRKFGLPYEPVVRESIELGVDVVTFSGDKVLGGPQSGILVGKREVIRRIKRNPLMRAVRCDKLTYALLEGTLRLFLDEKTLLQTHPVLRMMTEPLDAVRARAQSVMDALATSNLHVHVEMTESEAQAGSGTLPLERIRSVAIVIRPKKGSIHPLAKRLRLAEPAVMGYVHNNKLFLDMRTVLPDDLQPLISILKSHLAQ
ncbi:MAG: L-seryl-tRNA(Sec) selenium transferase [candidate division KSB1 bacterium]|nr:L-seryl-tRNA(Sec) selenium transferase [candidate division KSB1 bacterium]